MAHAHAHSDRVAHDDQFAGRPDTTAVDPGLDGVQTFFGFSAWPAEVVTFDLGGRVLEVTGIPRPPRHGRQDRRVSRER